jgi:hypothetical protein
LSIVTTKTSATGNPNYVRKDESFDTSKLSLKAFFIEHATRADLIARVEVDALPSDRANFPHATVWVEKVIASALGWGQSPARILPHEPPLDDEGHAPTVGQILADVCGRDLEGASKFLLVPTQLKTPFHSIGPYVTSYGSVMVASSEQGGELEAF